MKTPFKKLLAVTLLGAAATTISAQKAPVETQNELRVASPKPGGPNRVVSTQIKRAPEARTYAFAGHPFVPERANQNLIIQTSKTDEKDLNELREDMAVMARILEKAAAERGGGKDRVLGLELVLHGGQPSRNIFLEDYGVIFTLHVNMPLRENGASEESEKPHEKDVDAEWERARSELFGSKGTSVEGREKGRPFDAREVERLKNDLIDSLRNAANIRDLNADQWITVVVRGRDLLLPTELHGESDFFIAAPDRQEGGSTMVLKVRKSDIENYAKKGQMDEFRKRAVVNIY